MIWIIYLSGVIVTLIIGLIDLHQKPFVYLTDLITMIVFTILSWTALVFVAYEKLYDWMVRSDHDFVLWKNIDN